MNKRGSLRKENRKLGKVWVLRYLKTREADQKRVESTVVIGSVKNFPSERSAWEEVGRQHLQLHRPNRVRKTFTDLAEHYILHELGDQADAAIPKSVNTIAANLRILRKRLIPNWGNRVAVAIEPLEIEGWLKSLRQSEQLENPTLHKARSVMSLVYKSAQRYGLISRQREANPLHFVRCQTQSEYEAITCSLEQVRLILAELEKNGRHLERLVALVAIATGLRISECLGLQWQDVDCAGQRMFVRRTWIRGNVGKPKTKASRATVPMHLMLALEMLQWHKQTPWAEPTDWVFASARMRGKRPLTANILVEDHLRQAAARAGVLKSQLVGGKLVDVDPRRFGFHNLRHSLASFLVTKTGTDLRTVQDVMRHADAKTTIDEYTHSSPEDRLAAQAQVLALLKPGLERVQ